MSLQSFSSTGEVLDEEGKFFVAEGKGIAIRRNLLVHFV